MTLFNEQTVQSLKCYLSSLKPSGLSQFLYRLLPYRKKLVLDNMQKVFSSILSPNEIQHLAQCFYQHLGKSLLDMLSLRVISTKRLQDKVTVKGKEYVLNALSRNKGVVILTGHFGSWEFAPIAGILNFPEYKGRFHFIRKRQSIPIIEKLLFSKYHQAGLNIIPEKQALYKACDVLEQNDLLVYVMDQNANPYSRNGFFVEFFGHKIGTFRSLSVIARQSQAVVIPACSYRQADGQHVLEFHPELDWLTDDDAQHELYLNTLQYNQALEKMILARPEQWLWAYRRFKQWPKPS